VGVDVGLKQAAVGSSGRKLENQKPFALHVKKLGKLQRKLSKKQKTKDPETKRTVCSKNYEKQRLKVARKHQQIANIRRDVQHKFTTELTRTCGIIGLEDLNILGMMANRKLARAVADAAMGQLLRFLKTKITNAGGDLFIASRWFPSRHPLFLLWSCQEADAAQTSHLSLSGVWADHGEGCERGLEFAVVRNRTASPASRVKLVVLESGYRR
jgi:IS605 OrfB family transposase